MVSRYIYQNTDNVVPLPSEDLLKCWNMANLAVNGTVVIRDFSVFPNMCNSIHITATCLSCPVIFPSKSQTLQLLFSPGKEEGRGESVLAILPVIHADGNNLRKAIRTQEKPCIVRTALCQIVQGVADGCCSFTDNIRPWDRLGKY